MSSEQLYNSIFQEHIKDIENNQITIDQYLRNETIDNRRGISLIIPISFNNTVYTDLVKDYCDIEAYQYYYPETDLHITIFTFLSARDTYKNNEEVNRNFIDISETVLQNMIKQPFFCKFHLKQDDLLTQVHTVYHFAIDHFVRATALRRDEANFRRSGKLRRLVFVS